MSNATRVVWSTDWQPPAASALNFDPSDATLCAAAGAWKAKTLGLLQDDQAFITANYVIAYLLAILPASNETAAPDYWTLLHWWDDHILTQQDGSGNPILGSLLWKLSLFPLMNCAPDVCKNLDWVGDQDVSGLGMLITYYLAAALVTAYLFALALSESGVFRSRYSARSKRALVLGGFEESVCTFLDATLVFAVSMLAAACFRCTEAFFQEQGAANGHWMIYASLGSIYMSTFSALLPLALQSAAPGLRRHWLRIILWVLVVILAIIDEVLFDSFYVRIKSFGPEDLLEAVWLALCHPTELLVKGLTPTLRIAQILLVLNGIYYVVCKSCKGRFRNTGRWTRLKAFWQKAARYVQIVQIGVCCLLMWSMVGLFHYYRNLVDDAVGAENQNSDWTFGQVLAVATWVPVLVELVTVLKYGPEEGLSKRLSRKYAVVPSTLPTQDLTHDFGREFQYLNTWDQHEGEFSHLRRAKSDSFRIQKSNTNI
ncbi:hypothetical protein M426DRAFT_238361 [Hypoxylon sp. CI-4A]|nr:hypothetical protein M426DRAFT_238361 [Hypoxylon sp. CI-4A]